MKRFLIIPLIILVLFSVLILSACQPAANSQPVTSTEPASGEAPPSLVGQGNLFDLLQPAVGLDELSSYQASLTIQFQGTEGDQPVQWSRSYRMLVSRAGESFRQLDVETSRGSSGEGSAWRMLAEMGGYQFKKVGEEVCTALPAAQSVALAEQWEPANLLLGLSGAMPAVEETIEGQRALRYTFDQSSLGQEGLTQSTGEVWVASSSGVVLRYLLTQQGGEDYFGEGFAGTLSWTYEVTQIDQSQQLRMPEDCLRPAVLELPVPADAGQVNQSDDYISFITSLDETALLDFYRPILEADGWQQPETPDVSDFDLGDFDLGDINLDDFDSGEFDFDAYTDDTGEDGSGEDATDLGGTAGQNPYRFSRDLHTITLLVIPGDENNAVTIFLSTSQDTNHE